MNLEMTTSESCFQAENAATCYKHWQAHVSLQFSLQCSMTLRLNEAIRILMGNNYDKHAARFTNLSTLSLFTLVGGMNFPRNSLFLTPLCFTESTVKILGSIKLTWINNLPRFPQCCVPTTQPLQLSPYQRRPSPLCTIKMAFSMALAKRQRL